MNNEERYQKYIKEHCNKCKNRKTNLCNIRIFVIENTVSTKCEYYEKRKGAVKKVPRKMRFKL